MSNSVGMIVRAAKLRLNIRDNLKRRRIQNQKVCVNELAISSGVGTKYFSFGYGGKLKKMRRKRTDVLVQTISLDEYFQQFVHPDLTVILTLVLGQLALVFFHKDTPLFQEE